ACDGEATGRPSRSSAGQGGEWHVLCCIEVVETEGGFAMTYRALAAMAGVGVLAGSAWLAGATIVGAQQQPPPHTTPTQAAPPIGPADPNLRAIPLPNGKKLHFLPATLETTQWGWFDNAQPPVLRINAGDTVVLETMMHSHNQVIPGTTIDQIKK